MGHFMLLCPNGPFGQSNMESTLDFCPEQTSQEGNECTTTLEKLKAYCLNIYCDYQHRNILYAIRRSKQGRAVLSKYGPKLVKISSFKISISKKNCIKSKGSSRSSFESFVVWIKICILAEIYRKSYMKRKYASMKVLLTSPHLISFFLFFQL